MQQLHQIETILKQLNERSAQLQPGTVQRLHEIQKRFDAVSQSLSQKTNSQKANTAQSNQVQVTTSETLPIGNQQNTNQAKTAEAKFTRRDIEMTALVQSIVRANSKRRHKSHSSVSQPRFLTNSPVRQSIVVNDGSLQSGTGPDGSDYTGTSGGNFHSSESLYGSTFTVDQNWSVNDAYDANDKASSIAIEEAPGNSRHGSPATRTLPTESTTSKGASTTDISPDVLQLPPPVPHFNRGQDGLAGTDKAPQKDELPIFGSVWFRRSAPTKETSAIVQQILEKVPPVAPVTLQFTASGRSQAEAHLVTTQIAWELSRKTEGNVLLVDADFITREISRQLDNVYLPGLGEVLNLNQSSDQITRPTGVDKLFWLPSGMTDVSYRKTAGGRWFEISTELKKRFQYICIYSGAAEETVTNTWGRFCDYSFLIASMEDDLGRRTRNLVEHLRAQDCRIAGLITVD